MIWVLGYDRLKSDAGGCNEPEKLDHLLLQYSDWVLIHHAFLGVGSEGRVDRADFVCEYGSGLCIAVAPFRDAG